MTADSRPPRTAHAHGVERKPAVEAQLVSDLIAETRRHEHISLEAVERAFGKHFFDPRARSGIEAARRRAAELAEAAGCVTEGTALLLATDIFVSLAVERHWRRHEAGRLVAALAKTFRRTAQALEAELFAASVRAPQLLELPPAIAIDVQLGMLVVLTPAVDASLWTRDAEARPTCVVSVGETAATRRFRSTAQAILDGEVSATGNGAIVGIGVRRWHLPWAALVTRVPRGRVAAALLEETAGALSVIVERDSLLERNAARERSLVTASERRLSRLGFDLHDGALQHIAALGRDVRELESNLPRQLAGRTSVLDDRIVEIDRMLRELAHSLEPASLVRRPLEQVIAQEAEALEERAGIDVEARVSGDFTTMTSSQKIALIRVVQEAFTNIREHSGASHVALTLVASRGCVDLRIDDDGVGFEVARTLQDAAQRGRLGLVGGAERVRLLGGQFDVRSRPGGPTTVAVTLPRWQPLVAERESSLEFAY